MQFRVLAYLACGNANRDQSGYPKIHKLRGRTFPRISSQCMKSAMCCGPTSSIGCKLYRDPESKDKKNITRYAPDSDMNVDNRQFIFGRMVAGDKDCGWPGIFKCTDFLGTTGSIFPDNFTLNVENGKSASDHLGVRFLCSDTIFYGECNIELALWQKLCKDKEMKVDGVRDHIKNIIKSLIEVKPYSLLQSRNAGGFAVQFVLCSPTNKDFTIMDEVSQVQQPALNNLCECVVSFQNNHSNDPSVIWVKSQEIESAFVGLNAVDEFADKCIEETFEK